MVLPVEANRSGRDGALFGWGTGEHGHGGEGDGSGGVCTESELSEPVQPGDTDQVCGRADGRTTLRVYNALGQEVATLFDDMAEAGQYYTVKLNGMGLASGVYFYKLDSGTKSDLKRMLLLK